MSVRSFDLERTPELVLGPFVHTQSHLRQTHLVLDARRSIIYAQRYLRQTQLVLDALRLLFRRKASRSGTAPQEIEVGAYICTPPTVSCTLVLGLLDRVKHSDTRVRPVWSWTHILNQCKARLASSTLHRIS